MTKLKSIIWRIRGWHKPPYVVEYVLDEKWYGRFCFTRAEEKAFEQYIKAIGGYINAIYCTNHYTRTAIGEEFVTTIPHYEKYSEVSHD